MPPLTCYVQVLQRGAGCSAEECGEGSFVFYLNSQQVASPVEGPAEGVGLTVAYGGEPVRRHVNVAQQADGVVVVLAVVERVGQ